VVVLMVLAVLVPWLSASEEPTPERPTTDTSQPASVAPPPGRLAVDGVWLGMTKEQLLSNLGEASRVTPSNADYEQWDYFQKKRITLMLNAEDKVVNVEGSSLTRDGKAVVSPGMPLTEVEAVLGKCRESLDTIADSTNAGFSTEGQLVHLGHQNKKVAGRVSMMVDYSVVHAPPVNLVKEPPPKPDRIILREPHRPELMK
jgi:hypothetical protein